MIYEVYCDESRQQLFTDSALTDGRYVLIGGLWIRADDRQHLKSRVGELRDRHDVHSELKWRKVSPSGHALYCDLVRLFFEEAMQFRCIVLPAEQLDCAAFHEADQELMFYKFYYQLLYHWMVEPHTYRIFIDLKTNRVHGRVATLAKVLQNARPGSTVSVQALPSDELDLLQLADVLTGAVGYRFHGLETSTGKLAVVHEIERQLGHRIMPTSKAVRKFNVFRFHPSSSE
jgi:hypothetical protein